MKDIFIPTAAVDTSREGLANHSCRPALKLLYIISLKTRVVAFAGLLLLGFSLPAFGAAGCDGAGNCYVRSGASGSGNGADWNNAYRDLPTNLSRGVTYYVAGGSYGGHTFGDPDSGTTSITIQAATANAHGTSTGWTNTYASQATFSCCLQFNTDYYLFNGVYRQNTGNPEIDWIVEPAYGFRINNQSSPVCGEVVEVGSASPTFAHDVMFEYVDINGSHGTGGSCTDDGFNVRGGSYNVTAQYLYVHDTGEDLTNFFGNHSHPGGGGGYGSGSGNILQYSYLARNCCNDGGVHGQEIGVAEDEVNFTVRWNYFVDAVSTATISTDTPCDYNNCSGHNGPWYIYGNVFYGTVGGNHCAAGTGTIALYDVGFSGDLWIVNNTKAFLSNANCQNPEPLVYFDSGSGNNVVLQNVYIENNIFFKSDNENVYMNCNQPGLSCVSMTWDYNSWYAMLDNSSNADTSPHKQVSSADPFTASGSYFFSLLTDTAAGLNTTGLPGNAYDPLGTARGANGIWDRGTYQISGSQGIPAPPTNLTAVVQ